MKQAKAPSQIPNTLSVPKILANFTKCCNMTLRDQMLCQHLAMNSLGGKVCSDCELPRNKHYHKHKGILLYVRLLNLPQLAQLHLYHGCSNWTNQISCLEVNKCDNYIPPDDQGI